MHEFTVEHDGMRVYGRMAVPEGPGPFPVAIFSHGLGASHAYESGMDRDFVERGFAFAAFDFCGGGIESRSSGDALDMSVLTEAADLDAVIDAVRAHDRIDASRLFLVGTSQGGYVSSYVAAGRNGDVAGLVLFFPAFNIRDDARTRLLEAGGEVPDVAQIGMMTVGRRYGEDALAVDIYARLAEYTGPVLIVHGAKDEVVRLRYSQEAVNAFGGDCRLEVIEELGHGFRNYPPDLHRQALDYAFEFLEGLTRSD